MVISTPQLNQDFIGPLENIETHLLSKADLIESWFIEHWKKTKPPIYGSIDLRNAGFKIAPVDMNLFPAGFNNLNPKFQAVSVCGAKKIIEQWVPNAKHILIITESHTRNLFYWHSVYALVQTLKLAGYEVDVSVLPEANLKQTEMKIDDERSLQLAPLSRDDKRLKCGDRTPDLILLNNDLSEGVPEILIGLEQPLLPPAQLGWNQRLKSNHFQCYEEVCQEFSTLVDIDPWLISPLFRHCGKIDFLQQEGLSCLISNAELLFNAIKEKYKTYHINQDPFLVVKADAGTYGMAVMTVRHMSELENLNRKQRTRMSAIKGGQPVKRIIIQEGVYTFETFNDSVAEPVVYLWGDQVAGGFYRVHKEKRSDENLNAPGMQFEPLPFAQTCDHATQEKRFYVYGLIAKLSMLAAAQEMKRL